MDPIGSASKWNTESRYEWNILKGHEIVFAYPLLLTIYDETGKPHFYTNKYGFDPFFYSRFYSMELKYLIT